MSRGTPVIVKFRVMELDGGEIQRYTIPPLPPQWNPSPKDGYDTEDEAESDILKHLSQMGGLMGSTPILFVVKTFHGDN